MFLFHGTKARSIHSILKKGLVPPSRDNWLCRWEGYLEPSIFLSNLPRASWASDALGFASGGNEDGYLVVVDCDQAYLEKRLIGIWDSRDIDAFLGYGVEDNDTRIKDFGHLMSQKLKNPNSDCQYITTGIGPDKIFDVFHVYDGRKQGLTPDFNPKYGQKLPWKKRNFANLVWKHVLGKKRKRHL